MVLGCTFYPAFWVDYDGLEELVSLMFISCSFISPFDDLVISVHTLRFKISGGRRLFFRDFWNPPPHPQLILTPLFINFPKFTREYKDVYTQITDSWCFVKYYKWLRNIPEIPMLSELNKVFNDDLIFVTSLSYCFHPPFILTPHLTIF